MMETDEFSNGQWVEVKPYAGPIRRMFRWLGVNWITHPNLTGVGTAAEKCYIYHKDAIGHAFDSRGMNVAIGHNDEHHYDFVRASGYFGSVKLQNAGIVQMVHDGSAFALS
jgi:hypothetical protein